jgi:heptosyltransferase-3
MRLLFIKLKHIGDSLLLTPTLMAARNKYPQARIGVVVRKGCEGILEGCPAIDELFVSAAAPEAQQRHVTQLWNELRLIQSLRRENFDYAFELSDGDRGRFLAFMSGAQTRCANRVGTPIKWLVRRQFHCLSNFDWRFAHRVEKDFQTVSTCLPLGLEIPPLCFERSRTQPWLPGASLRDFAVLHPGSRWQRKRWPIERWIELTQRLLACVSNVIVSSGPAADERSDARRIEEAASDRVLSTDGQANWAQLAGLLHQARLFVGVDTAAMHLAAACQCPTVAIFGPSVETAWRPWKVAHRLVMAPAANIPTTDPDYFRKKEKLDVSTVALDDVWNVCVELLERKGVASASRGCE